MIDPMVFLECSHSKDLKTTFEYILTLIFPKKKTTFCVFHMFMVHFISLNLRDTFCKKSLFFYVSCILTYKGHKHVSIFYTCLLYGCLVPPYALVVTFWVFFGDVSIVSYADNVHSFLEQYFWDPSSENFSENSKIIF